MLGLLALTLSLWVLFHFMIAIFIVGYVSLEGRLTMARIYVNLRRCVEKKQCKRKDDLWHVFAETVAWKIVNKDRPNWRLGPAICVEAFLLILPWPWNLAKQLFGRAKTVPPN